MRKPNPNWEKKNKTKEQFEQQCGHMYIQKPSTSKMYGSEKLP